MKLGLAVGALFLGVVSCVGAQGPGGQPRLVLKALDTDGDGKLSAAEIAAAPKTLLTLDRNEDGQITPDEVLPPPETAGATADDLVKQLMSFDKADKGYLVPMDVPERMQNLFARGDVNQNGKLTPEEIRAMARRQGMPSGGVEGAKRMAATMKNDPLLVALDANHDGVISAEEIANAPRELLTLDVNRDGEITPDEMRPHQATPEERVDHMLDEWDTNKDGKISKAEAPDRMQAIFEQLDTNHDGFLDRDELIAYFKTMGNQQRGGGRSEGAKPQGDAQQQPAKEQK